MAKRPMWDELDKQRWINGARSLYPNERLMDDFVEATEGNEEAHLEARAIIAMWNPRRSMLPLITPRQFVTAHPRKGGAVMFDGPTGLFGLDELGRAWEVQVGVAIREEAEAA